jgi:hypothetical protein
MVTQEEHDLAAERGRQIKESGLYAVAARFDAATGLMHVTLKKGFTVSFPKERSQVMANATNEDLSEVEVSGAGWYVIFPKLDDGFTVEGMLAGRFGNDRWEREWAEKHRDHVLAA